MKAKAEATAKAAPTGQVRRAVGALVVVNVLWGASFPLMTVIDRVMARWEAAESAPSRVAGAAGLVGGACFYATVRFTVALVLLALLLPGSFRGLTPRRWLMGMAVGLPFAAGFVLQAAALNEIPASRSAFLTSLCVVFTPLLATAIERRPPSRRVLGGIALALLGTALLTGILEPGGAVGLRLAADASGQFGWGDWVTVLAALLFAVQVILVDAFSRAMPPEKLTPGMFVAVAVLSAAAAACFAASDRAGWRLSVRASELSDPAFLLPTLATSLFCTVLAFHLMNKHQGRLSPSHASLLYTLEPVCATVWAMLLPDLLGPLTGIAYPSERPGLSQLAGGVLIVSGTVVSLLPRRTPGRPDLTPGGPDVEASRSAP